MFFFYFKEYKKTGIDCSSIPESLEPFLVGTDFLIAYKKRLPLRQPNQDIAILMV